VLLWNFITIRTKIALKLVWNTLASAIITGLGLQPVAGWFFIAVEHFVGLQLLS
jgi:hypothetical protein